MLPTMYEKPVAAACWRKNEQPSVTPTGKPKILPDRLYPKVSLTTGVQAQRTYNLMDNYSIASPRISVPVRRLFNDY